MSARQASHTTRSENARPSAKAKKRVVVVSYGMRGAEAGAEGEQGQVGEGKQGHRCSLERELSLARPALLYSDRVTLISTAYTLNSAFARHMRSVETQPHKFLEFIAALSPSTKHTEDWTEVFRAKRTFERSPSARKRAKARKVMTEFVSEILDAHDRISGGKRFFSELIDYDGLEELNQAAQAGILDVENVPGMELSNIGSMVHSLAGGLLAAGLDAAPDDGQFDQMGKVISQLVGRLVEVVKEQNSYPMLDDHARRILQGRCAEDFSDVARDRSRVGGVAAHIMGRLPVFDTSLLGIAEIRHALSDNLGAFHLAIADLAQEVKSAQWERGFTEEVSHLYATRVDPVVKDLEARLADIRSPKNLALQRRAASVEAFKTSAAVFVGFGAASQILQDWVSTAMLAAAALPISMATFARRLISNVEGRIAEQLDALRDNRFYYYVGAEDMLSERSQT